MSLVSEVLFFVAACFAVIFAIGTISSSNPLRAALNLLGHIVSLAAIYLSLSAELLAAIQLLVYAGAVVVLFIFTIMLLGPSAKEEIAEMGATSASGWINKSVVLSFVVMIVLTIGGAVVGYHKYIPAICPSSNTDCGFGGIEAVGTSLFQKTAVPFELVSITLLVAVVGAIAVAKGRSKEEKDALSDKRRIEQEQKTCEEENAKLLSKEVAAYEGH